MHAFKKGFPPGGPFAVQPTPRSAEKGGLDRVGGFVYNRQGDLDTDSGDHPGNLPGCHLFFAAYLRRLTRGRRAFLRL